MDQSEGGGVMNITLSPEQMQLIEAQLAQGSFSSPSEVITKALLTLAQTQKHYSEWEEEVRKSIEQAEAELSRGEGIQLETAIEQLQEKFRKARESVKNCET
jgi:antitoxin ParD1/3/4